MLGKRILCLDFDGTLVVNEQPVAGLVEALREYSEHFAIAIYSPRSASPGGRAAMRSWLWEVIRRRDDATQADEEMFGAIDWPVVKPSAFVTLDDRGVTFRGVWPGAAELLAFRPWHKEVADGGGSSEAS